MPTDQTIDPSTETPAKEPTPPETDQPSDKEPTESVEELKEKLAAAETEAKRWKGRVEKANEDKPKKTKVDPEDLADLEWKLENKERIKLVQDEYDKILAEGYQGEKVSKKIALELAEKQAKVDSSETKRSRQDDMSVPSVTTRSVHPKGYTSESDRALGLTAEKKRKLEEKHPHLLET